MRVVRIDTIRSKRYPAVIWVRVHTDAGLIGLGEGHNGPASIEARIHESIAPYLLGQNPLRIDAHSKNLRGMVGYASSGAEVRANAVVDLALWDIMGKVTGQTIYQLIGGKWRDAVPAYATCLNQGVASSPPWGAVVRMETKVEANGVGSAEDAFAHIPPGKYADDGDRSWKDPEGLAEELLNEGYRVMKIQMGGSLSAFI